MLFALGLRLRIEGPTSRAFRAQAWYLELLPWSQRSSRRSARRPHCGVCGHRAGEVGQPAAGTDEPRSKRAWPKPSHAARGGVGRLVLGFGVHGCIRPRPGPSPSTGRGRSDPGSEPATSRHAINAASVSLLTGMVPTAAASDFPTHSKCARWVVGEPFFQYRPLESAGARNCSNSEPTFRTACTTVGARRIGCLRRRPTA